MVFEEASSGLKRDRKRLMIEVLAVPAPPTKSDACQERNCYGTNDSAEAAGKRHAQLGVC